MPNPFYDFPADARPAFIRFDRRLENAWANEVNDAWVNTPGLTMTVSMGLGAEKARFTLPAGLFAFMKLKERPVHFTHLSGIFAEVDWEEWQEGVEDKYTTIVSSPNFNYWDKNEIGMSAARRQSHATEIARIFNDNPVGKWNDINSQLFSETQNVNLINTDLGTQANITFNLALTATNVPTALTLFRKHKGLQGREMGADPDTVIVPTDLLETANGIFNPLYLQNGVNSDNRFRGRFKILWIPQLTDPNRWYLAKLGNTVHPPILWAQGNNGQLRVKAHGLQSKKYLEEDKLAASYHDYFAAHPGLWHLIHAFDADAS